jgi:hypothetical protein
LSASSGVPSPSPSGSGSPVVLVLPVSVPVLVLVPVPVLVLVLVSASPVVLVSLPPLESLVEPPVTGLVPDAESSPVVPALVLELPGEVTVSDAALLVGVLSPLVTAAEVSAAPVVSSPDGSAEEQAVRAVTPRTVNKEWRMINLLRRQ